MREILARQEFRPPQKSIIERGLDFVGRQLDRLLTNLFRNGAGSLIAWAIVAAAFALIVFVVIRVRASMRLDPRLRVGEIDERLRPAREWRAEAEAHEARGEWRDALRCRYRALVADLSSRGLVDEIPGRTTGEYRRAVALSVPLAATDFSGATALFEEAWYGEQDTGPDEHAQFRGHADRVMAGAR